MSQFPEYPGISQKVHKGVKRWRFRKAGFQERLLPGEPHTYLFDLHYRAAVEGRKPPKAAVEAPMASAEIIPIHGGVAPTRRSFKHAYLLLKKSDDWITALSANTQKNYSTIIESILTIELPNKTILGEGPITEFTRKDSKALLSRWNHRPFMKRLVLIMLHKLFETAMDEEWMEYDPSAGIVVAPKSEGFKAWSHERLAKFENHFAIGTRQRLAYALGLWLGNRVSDVADLNWDHLVEKRIVIDGKPIKVEGFEFVQFKGRKKNHTPMFLPMTPMLGREIAHLERKAGEPVLISERGRKYGHGSLSELMSKWAEEALGEPGYTMHGLRKALGAKLAEADASTRQLMEVLGHSNMAYSELYSRSASRVRLSVEGMRKVTDLEEAFRTPPPLRVVK